MRDDTALIPPPIQIKAEQKILDVIASLQEASNLKEQQVIAQGVVNQMAKVHYRLVGLDRPATNGSCPVKGYGDILVTFIVSQPAGMQTVGFNTIQADSLLVTLSGKSGTLKLMNRKAFHSIDDLDLGHQQANTVIKPGDVLIKGTGGTV